MGRQVDFVRGLHHLTLCDYRSQNRLIQSPEFTEVWENASDEQRETITKLIDKPDPDKLKQISRRCVELSLPAILLFLSQTVRNTVF